MISLPTTLRLMAAAVAGAVVVAAAGCGGSSTTSPSSPGGAQPPVQSGQVAVQIKNFAFAPTPLTVRVGTTVTWTNDDPTPTIHTATADDGSFDTGNIQPGKSASHTFSTPGTYAYHCAIHNYMRATITVTG